MIYIELRRVHGEDIFIKALILRILHLRPWQGNHAKEILGFPALNSNLYYRIRNTLGVSVNSMNMFIRTRCLKEEKSARYAIHLFDQKSYLKDSEE